MRSDALLLVGFGVFVYGVAELSVAAALMIGGLLLSALGIADGVRTARRKGESRGTGS